MNKTGEKQLSFTFQDIIPPSQINAGRRGSEVPKKQIQVKSVESTTSFNTNARRRPVNYKEARRVFYSYLAGNAQAKTADRVRRKAVQMQLNDVSLDSISDWEIPRPDDSVIVDLTGSNGSKRNDNPNHYQKMVADKLSRIKNAASSAYNNVKIFIGRLINRTNTLLVSYGLQMREKLGVMRTRFTANSTSPAEASENSGIKTIQPPAVKRQGIKVNKKAIIYVLIGVTVVLLLATGAWITYERAKQRNSAESQAETEWQQTKKQWECALAQYQARENNQPAKKEQVC